MYSKTIQANRKRCIFEVDQLFNKDREVLITRKTDSLIEFKKGSFWTISTSARKVDLRGSITFEGNETTKVEIIYDRYLKICATVLTTLIAIIFGIIFIILGNLFRNNSGGFSTFLLIMGVIEIILGIIVPIETIYLTKEGRSYMLMRFSFI